MEQPTHIYFTSDTKNTFIFVLQCHFTWDKALLWYKQVKLFQPMQHESILHSQSLHPTQSWQLACRASGVGSLLHFSLLTDLFLMYFFASDFSWLLSKHRLDTTPAVPAPPLKNTHWAFLTVWGWITTVVHLCESTSMFSSYWDKNKKIKFVFNSVLFCWGSVYQMNLLLKY